MFEFKLNKFLEDSENISEDLPDDSRDLTRSNVTNVITNFIHNSHTEQPSNFEKTYNTRKNFLKEQPELLIMLSDKGGCTVAMNREEYYDKTEALLIDHLPVILEKNSYDRS